jgi:hypothetical protein
MTVDLAENPVLRLPTVQRQQPHYDVHPTRDKCVRTSGRGSHSLPHLEAMVRHPTHLGWRRSGRNRSGSRIGASHAARSEQWFD